jgi:hypothetical protein
MRKSFEDAWLLAYLSLFNQSAAAANYSINFKLVTQDCTP